MDIGPTAGLVAEAAQAFPQPEVTVQPGAGHFPWVDDGAWFTAAIETFLA